MLRIVIAVLIAYLVFRLAARLMASSSKGRRSAARGERAGEMVACARCGTFILRTEAVREGESFFCSDKCRRAG